MKNAFVLAIVLFIGSLVFGSNTATMTVINGRFTPPPTPDAFEQSCIVLNDTDVLTMPNWEFRVAWSPHYNNGGTDDEKNAAGEGRNDLMQTFRIAPGGVDTDMGGFAVQLNHKKAADESTDMPMIYCDGSTLVLSLYVVREIGDQRPQDRNLVAQWEAFIPPGTSTIPGDDSTARRGAWLKFTFDTGYRLKAGVQYGMRISWKDIQPGDPDWWHSRYMVLWGCSTTAPYPPGAFANKYDGRWVEGPYQWGQIHQFLDVRRPLSQAVDVRYGPFWTNWSRDINFGILGTLPEQPVNLGNPGNDSVSLPEGDVSMDGDVDYLDFAQLAENWGVIDRATLSDTDIPCMSDANAPTVDVMVLNDQPTATVVDDTPWIQWTRTEGMEGVTDPCTFQMGQSFRVTENGTMGGIAIQLASDRTKPISAATSGRYTIKVYSLATADTLPQNGALLKTFIGQWLDHDADYPSWPYEGLTTSYQKKICNSLFMNAWHANWLTFILPSGVDVTANHYYAFTITWNDIVSPPDISWGSDYAYRRFFMDCSTPGGTDVYADGRAFYQEGEPAYAAGTWSHFDSSREMDLDFAVLSKKYVCTDNTYGFQRIAGDLNRDCAVNMQDFDVLALDWLTDNLN